MADLDLTKPLALDGVDWPTELAPAGPSWPSHPVAVRVKHPSGEFVMRFTRDGQPVAGCVRRLINAPEPAPEPYAYEVGKTYKTRDGQDAKIIYVDRLGPYPILALVGPDKEPHTYTHKGRFLQNSLGKHSLDLLPPAPAVPETKTVWINFYPHRISGGHKTRERADAWAGDDRVACIPVTYYDGEGL